MTPENQAKYDRIRGLRDEIGPIDFDVVAELRTLRGYNTPRTSLGRRLLRIRKRIVAGGKRLLGWGEIDQWP